MNNKKSELLFKKAKEIIPGGVNSPVRAFKSVGGNPVFISKAKGAILVDEDNNRYIDLINSWGPMIFGHAPKFLTKTVQKAAKKSLTFGAPSRNEVVMAQLITEMVPSIEQVRMVNSGTEATMSAIRLARGYTKRNKIIKFIGNYHGHGDSFLIAAGSGAMTMGTPDSPGVTQGTAQDTLLAPYNNLESVNQIIKENRDQIAAIILEPVVGNMGCVLPESGFLEGLRSICDENNIVLIFDEVMTGFRLAMGGAQELFGVLPDITTLGKIVGGGMPVGAYGGKKEIMSFVSPEGPVYQAGTLSGNPVAMAAGISVLKRIKKDKDLYKNLNDKGKFLKEGFEENNKKLGHNFTVNQIGSMISLFFTSQKVIDFDSASTSNLEYFKVYFNSMLNKGVYLAPSQFESLFISDALTTKQLKKIISSNYESLSKLTIS